MFDGDPAPAPDPPPVDPTGDYVVRTRAVQECWCWAPLHEWVYQGKRSRAVLWAATAADIAAYLRPERPEHDLYTGKGFCLRTGRCHLANPITRPPDPKIVVPRRRYRKKPKTISLIVAFTVKTVDKMEEVRVRVPVVDIAAAEHFATDAFGYGLRIMFASWMLYVPPSALITIWHRNPYNPAGYPDPEFTDEELDDLQLTPEYIGAFIEPFTDLLDPRDNDG